MFLLQVENFVDQGVFINRVDQGGRGSHVDSLQTSAEERVGVAEEVEEGVGAGPL